MDNQKLINLQELIRTFEVGSYTETDSLNSNGLFGPIPVTPEMMKTEVTEKQDNKETQ